MAKEKHRIVYIIALFLPLSLCVYVLAKENKLKNNIIQESKLDTELNKNLTDKLFYTKYGTLYCAQAFVDICGLRLIKCQDERNYYCLHDVAVKQ